MSRDIHIIIKKADDLAFQLLVVGLVLVWFLFVFFSSNQKEIIHPESQVWRDQQKASPSSGMEW
jgi:hypothetical protein